MNHSQSIKMNDHDLKQKKEKATPLEGNLALKFLMTTKELG
jgi:hypothetical protein